MSLKSSNKTKNFISDWSTLKHGVPHGSMLRPRLFKIHVNDLPLRINSISETILFADDISVKIEAGILNIPVLCQI